MALNTFTLLSNNYHHSIYNFFSSKTETLYSLNNNSPFPYPELVVTTILLSVSINLTTPRNLYKWNHTIFIILWLVHPCFSMLQNFHSLLGWINVTLYVYHIFFSFIYPLMSIWVAFIFWSYFGMIKHFTNIFKWSLIWYIWALSRFSHVQYCATLWTVAC